MSVERDNVEALQELYRTYARTKGQDLSCILDLLAEDVKWGSIGAAEDFHFTQDCDSADGVRCYLEGLYAEWDMERYDVREYLAQGDRVVVLGDVAFRHKKTGKLVESPKADVFRLRDGKIVEFYEFFDTAKALDACR